MSYLKFDKTQLVNLEYSLTKEILLSNESGVYCSTSLVGCNTRKYHGLLVAPIPSIDGGKHVLLSSRDETVIQHNKEFNLGINKYPGEYNPKGHKYARWFEADPLPKIIYRVGGVVIQKELLLVENEPRVMIRYTLLEATSPTKIRIKPFIAFRSIHKLSKANMYANQKVGAVRNGIKTRLYQEYPELYLQVSKKCDFVAAPDWYLDVEYPKEQMRGYDFNEDLFVPGYFEMDIKKGISIVVSAGLSEISPMVLTKRFNSIAEKILPKDSFDDWLSYSAHSFIRKSEVGVEVVPGYHWFGRWGRHTFISLPGISTTIEDKDFAIDLLKSLTSKMKGGLLPDHSPNVNEPVYGNADTSLWFIWSLQKLSEMGYSKTKLQVSFNEPVRRILNALKNSDVPGVNLHNNGLLHAFLPGRALTWMDSYIDGQPVTQRPGYVIEINALWYNAICFALEGAKSKKDQSFISEWSGIKKNIEDNFLSIFWDEENRTLYDHVYNGVPNKDVRPNMLIAASMTHTPLSEEQIKDVLDHVEKELLVPKGIRSLSPRSEDFKPTYEGDHHLRDLAYHQGSVWPWLSGIFAEAWLRIHEKSGVTLVRKLLQNYEEDLMDHGIGLIPEVYDGNPPHRPCGAISFASSTGELLRIKYLLSKY